MLEPPHRFTSPAAGWRLIIGLVALLVLSACLTDPRPDLPQDSLVTYETVRFQYTPEESDENLGEGSTGGLSTWQAALVGDPSDTRLLTQSTILSTNRLLFSTLATLEVLNLFPPTHAKEDEWHWIHEEDGIYNLYALRDLSEEDAPHYAYLFQKRFAEEEDDALRAVFNGSFLPLGEPLGPRGRVRQGEGILRYFFDEDRPFNPEAATGEMRVSFRSKGSVRQVKVAMDNVQGDNDPEPITMVYSYLQLPTGSGELEFAAKVDFLNDGEPLEDFVLRTLWIAEGEGRAIARITGGSLTQPEVIFHECWDRRGETVWLKTEPSIPSIEGGSEAACAEAFQGITPEPPSLVTPDGDPEIPAPHPDEE